MLSEWISTAHPIIASFIQEPLRTPWVWWVVGGVGQAVFFSRFLVQWLVSEAAKRSVIPTAFWWLSLVGSSLLLAYAIYRQDPIFIIGQMSGFLIYTRNLVLIQKERTAGT
jgi:lipid-A-disaccharide synthase-like uncharacterized protein